MINIILDGRSKRFSRRTFLGAATTALAMPAVIRSTRAFAQDKLAGSGQIVAYSYGGSFTDNFRKAILEPFTKATGIQVVDVTADFSEPQVKAMNQAGRVDWDTAFVQGQYHSTMSKAGMFEDINYSLWDEESIKGAEEIARLKDGVVAFQSGQLLTYDERVFGGNGPKSWADFWDAKAFPGPRGLYAPAAKFSLVFALLADGVAKSDIWPLTDDKVERALKKLDEIKPKIAKWWTAGGESAQLLVNREYVMSSSFDTRSIVAIRGQKAPIRMVWGAGAQINRSYWTVLRGGPNTANAQKLVAFANRAQIAANFTAQNGTPGPNTNQLSLLPPDLAQMLSINPENAKHIVLEDSAWLSETRRDGKTNIDHIQERWLAWRAS